MIVRKVAWCIWQFKHYKLFVVWQSASDSTQKEAPATADAADIFGDDDDDALIQASGMLLDDDDADSIDLGAIKKSMMPLIEGDEDSNAAGDK